MTEPVTSLDKLSTALADRYTIEREIGVGGMATVYLAEDVKHHRKVAVKVLHPELSAVLGPDRFLKEIELTANLQHPHILPLFDSGNADGHLYYVMPFVEGETLRRKLEREQQLPIAEAVRIATDVADALEYAHKRGVVHRDIKPENILLHEGRPLVADFGIALAVQQAGGSRMTQTGMSLGTPQYMAPEQAMGDKSVDHRADIYALGAITYEMLTGEPPFTGPNSQAVVAKILTTDPSSLVSKRRSVPPHVETAVLCALEKMPADRFNSAAQFAEAMAGRGPVLPVRPGTSAGAVAAKPTTRRNILALAPWLLAAIAVGVAGWAVLQTPDKTVTRQRMMLWRALTPVTIVGRGLAVSPDGNTLAFVDTVGGRGQLWIKDRDQLDPVTVAGTVGARSPVFSPDGEWLAFLAEGKLKKVPRLGGSPIAIADSAATSGATAWLDDGTILFADPSARLRAVSQDGGPQRRVFPLDSVAATGVVNSTGLPGGRAALITICTPGCTDAQLAALDLTSGKTTMLASEVLKAWYVDGDVVFVRRDGGVFAVPFDLNKLKFAGAPVPILDGVRTSTAVPDMAVSSNGTLMYIAGAAQAGALVEPVWVDRRGQASVIDSGWSFVLAANSGIALSPDGRRLALGASTAGSDDIWIKELERGPLRRLTFDGANARPTWSRDGLSVMYSFVKAGGNSDLRQRHANGTGAEETVADLARAIYGAELTPDSATLLLRLGQSPTRDIVLFRRGSSTPTSLLASNGHDEITPSLSPDGRWLAYSSDESGKREIYVRPYPDVNAGKWQISRNVGTEPLWSRSGRELFFRDGAGNLVSAAISPGTEFVAGEQSTLFSARPFRVFASARMYDVAPGDARFVFLRPIGGESESVQPVIRVENWIIDVKNALRGKR